MRIIIIFLTALLYAGEPPPRWVSLGEIDSNINEVSFVIVSAIQNSEQLGLRLVTVTVIESNDRKYNGQNWILCWNRNPGDWDNSQERGLTSRSDSKVVVNIGDKYVIAVQKDEITRDKVYMAAYQGQAIYSVTIEEWVNRRNDKNFNQKTSVFQR